MRLLLRPMPHVARADVACEYFRSRELRGAVDAIFEDIVAAVPIRPREQILLEQRRKGPAAERSDVHRNAPDQARSQHLSTRGAHAVHAESSCSHAHILS